MTKVTNLANKRNGKATKLEAEVIELTPKLAQEFLELNVGHQRHLAPSRLEMYQAQMERGDWKLTGQPIIFDRTGAMIDGQHRCMAAVRAHATIPMLVVRGVEPGTFVKLDTGRQRAAQDILAIRGLKNTHNLAACARSYLAHKYTGELHIRGTGGGNAISSSEVAEIAEEHPRMQNVARFYTNQSKYIRTLGTGVAVLAALHCILMDKRVALGLIEEFFNKLIYGENLKKSDPIYQLRAALIQHANSPTHKLQRRVRDARLIKTWNAWCTGNVGPTATAWNGLRDDYPQIITPKRK